MKSKIPVSSFFFDTQKALALLNVPGQLKHSTSTNEGAGILIFAWWSGVSKTNLWSPSLVLLQCPNQIQASTVCISLWMCQSIKLKFSITFFWIYQSTQDAQIPYSLWTSQLNSNIQGFAATGTQEFGFCICLFIETETGKNWCTNKRGKVEACPISIV